MPWRVRWEFYTIILGVAVLVLSIIVAVVGRDLAVHLLAVAGIAGGISIILNAMPHDGGNGSGGRWRDYSNDRR